MSLFINQKSPLPSHTPKSNSQLTLPSQTPNSHSQVTLPTPITKLKCIIHIPKQNDSNNNNKIPCL